MSIEKIFQKIDYLAESKKLRRYCYCCLAASLVIPIFALTGCFKPSAESLGVWFQRSGALVVLFASAAEIFANKMVSIFNPSGLANEPEITSKVSICSQATGLMIISAIFIFMGTVIWGYGDLFFKFT